MIWQNVLALAVFVIVCGFIAYVGDILGRRMGKRRLTLFGLRPRYTAIVMTTITGMLIAIFTIAVMVTASTAVQQLALRGYQVLHQLRETQAAYHRVSRQVQAQQQIVRQAREETLLAVNKRNELARELDSINKAIARLKSELARNQAALVGTKSNLATAKRDLARLQAEITRRTAALNALTGAFAAHQKYIKKETEPTYIALRERHVIFSPGEEVARKVISFAQSKRDIRNDVVALLNEADKRARARGATVGKYGRTVGILPVQIGKDFLLESKSIDLVADKIFGGTGNVVLLVVSVGNAVEGEPTLVDFRPFYDRLIYSAGQEVATTTIDGDTSRGQIFGKLVVFLRNEVRSKAVGEGVIPTYDEEGQPSVGQMAGDQLFDIVDRVKALGGNARVTAIATKEIWSADTLDLKFEVTPAP